MCFVNTEYYRNSQEFPTTLLLKTSDYLRRVFDSDNCQNMYRQIFENTSENDADHSRNFIKVPGSDWTFTRDLIIYSVSWLEKYSTQVSTNFLKPVYIKCHRYASINTNREIKLSRFLFYENNSLLDLILPDQLVLQNSVNLGILLAQFYLYSFLRPSKRLPNGQHRQPN